MKKKIIIQIDSNKQKCGKCVFLNSGRGSQRCVLFDRYVDDENRLISCLDAEKQVLINEKSMRKNHGR